MNVPASVLDPIEIFAYALRRLYASHGFSRYRMSKFEEYDLYSRHKEFLVSDGVLTFTDTDGRLRALKPDVTLSIIKNTRDREDPLAVDKLYYCENVYRISKQSGEFREIQQIGLECIGGVDDLCVCEMLQLAAESLEAIGRPYFLEISHTGLLSAAADLIVSGSGVSDPDKLRSDVLTAVKTKNRSLAGALVSSAGLGEAAAGLIFEMTSSETDLKRLSGFFEGENEQKIISGLRSAMDVLKAHGFGEKAAVDLSVDAGADYYNGIVFRGYVEGMSERVLSGGRYDLLMRKMGRKGSAVGFAVYLDVLGRLGDTSHRYDAETVLIYRDGDDVRSVLAKAEQMSAEGSVFVCRSVPEGYRYRRTAEFSDLKG